MRTLTKFVVPSVLAGSVLLPATVRAQAIDVEPPMPNVLILLDTSGSMSRKMGEEAFPDCSDGATKAELDETRWFAVVQALTGEIPADAIGCQKIDRVDGTFTDLYGSDIYDKGYYIPFYQLQSNGCGHVPGDWDGGWHTVEADDIALRQAPSLTGACGAGWEQRPDGVIDTYKNMVRFGLMTFDPLVDPAVGRQGPNTDVSVGSAGTFSYWFSTSGDWKGSGPSDTGSWFTGTNHADGRPPACEAPQEMEVGARGPTAPPWEGRLMPFGRDRAAPSVVSRQNEILEKVILSARPFGATPLAGMLSDAADFILNDDTTINDGDGNTTPLGPKDDELWGKGQACRPFHVILITDGEPNLDLLSSEPGLGCDSGDGDCPFRSMVHSPLYDGIDVEDSTVNYLQREHGIRFHVVGVSLEEVSGGNECAGYRTGGDHVERCTASDITAEEKTCCLLNAIAEVGDTDRALFASKTEDVRSALNLVLRKLAEGTASRTTTVYQSVTPTFHVTDDDASAVGHEIRSSLKTTVGSGMWNGRLERVRFVCPEDAPVPERATFTAALGDDFDDNLAETPDQRYLFTVTPTTDPSETWRSLRPHATTDDGVGLVGVTPTAGLAGTWATSVPFEALDPDAIDCERHFEEDDLEACAAQVLTWYAGLPSDAETDRIPDPLDRDNSPSPMGAIYHSQPVVVGPPREFVRDESYDIFAVEQAARPTVVYAATVDGQLHAFLLADNTGRLEEHEDFQADALQRNELWSFVPPIALPYVARNVNQHALLLDGGITVRNVAYERTAEAIGGTSEDYTGAVKYRTAMVVSSGNAAGIPGGGYYFALDVTDPHAEAEDFDGSPPDERAGSPKFLWQLSRDDAATGPDDENSAGDGAAGDADGNDNPTSLFGEAVPAASITTIAYADPTGGSTEVREIAVAILAGGLSDAPSTFEFASFDSEALFDGADENKPRTSVRNWGTRRADRSLTIVRLDTGEILWRFVGQPDDPKGVVASRAKEVGFMAPISGTPVAFPGLPGQVSSRIYVGDAEGMLWEIDLTNPDPSQWSMEIAWDPYREVTDEQRTSGEVVVGPVETVPLVSVNEAGDPVVIFATGSQESFYDDNGTNYVVSVTRPVVAADDDEGYVLNWELDLERTENLGQIATTMNPNGITENFGAKGQRVTGPLNLFDGVVYFSTFVPSEDACDVGASRVWGVHYLEASEDHEQKVPRAAWDPDLTTDGDDYFVQDDAAIIFGVAIGQQPSCRNTEESEIDDPLFGRYTTFISEEAPAFQLTVQTGRRIGGDVADDGPTTKTFDWQLRAPVSTVRIDGWASIVE